MLAGVFENLWKKFFRIYRLGSAKFLLAPGLALEITPWKESVFGIILLYIFPVFSCICTEYREILHLTLHSARMQENPGKMRTRVTPNMDSFYAVNNLTKKLIKDIFIRLIFNILKNYMNFIRIYHFYLIGRRLKSWKACS